MPDAPGALPEEITLINLRPSIPGLIEVAKPAKKGNKKQELGVYILVLTLQGERAIGRLGKHHFAGTYLYVGSAQGPGGFKRLLRHQEVALGQRRVKRWHIDYLLPEADDLKALWLRTEARLECPLAQQLSQIATPTPPGFGCSDCRCPSHLFKLRGKLTEVVAVLKRCGLKPRLFPLRLLRKP